MQDSVHHASAFPPPPRPPRCCAAGANAHNRGDRSPLLACLLSLVIWCAHVAVVCHARIVIQAQTLEGMRLNAHVVQVTVWSLTDGGSHIWTLGFFAINILPKSLCKPHPLSIRMALLLLAAGAIHTVAPAWWVIAMMPGSSSGDAPAPPTWSPEGEAEMRRSTTWTPEGEKAMRSSSD